MRISKQVAIRISALIRGASTATFAGEVHDA